MLKAALIILTVVIVTVVSFVYLRPPNRYEKMTEAQIQAELLKDIPLGSSSERVRSYLRRKTGRDAGYSRDFYTGEGKAIIRNGKVTNLRYYAGAAYATLADYRPQGSSFFSLVSVQVQTRWEFDKGDRLIDVSVAKRPFGP